MRTRLSVLLFAVGFLFSLGNSIAADPKVPGWVKPFVGEWRGAIKCNNPSIRDNLKKMVFIIDPQGIVTGRVGDCPLGTAKLEKLHGRFHTLTKGDFMIWGDMVGTGKALTEKQKVAFFMPFLLRDGQIEGMFHSSGEKIGIQSGLVNNSWRILHLNRLSLK